MSKKIRLLYMEGVSPLRSQTVYHAVGYAMKEDTPNTIIMVSPNAPYVCIGYHQDMQKEVDLDYCASQWTYPCYRREVGGGAVFLDNGQLFTQWIFHKERFALLHWKNDSNFTLIRLSQPIRRWASMPIIVPSTMCMSTERRSAARARRKWESRKCSSAV